VTASRTSAWSSLTRSKRFGVIAEGELKQLRDSVDVLHLSATPRSRGPWHMALAGFATVRHPDASEGENGFRSRTFVTADDDDLIKEVIQRELQRGGQVFSSTTGCKRSRRRRSGSSGWSAGAGGVGHGQCRSRRCRRDAEVVQGDADVWSARR